MEYGKSLIEQYLSYREKHLIAKQEAENKEEDTDNA